jgi:uncharacterized protein YyaL (SSP411 family)
MPNRLHSSTSPYLQQHAHNPVDWYPWGSEALQKARAEDKPIFLSIGYSACHWCHVMERESFENPKTAEIMNKLFVNVKVDREERPDIDAIYMKSVVLMTGAGGWPTSVWLTPDLKPFFGGTYFPPAPRAGQHSFPQILLLLGAAWRDKRAGILASADDLIDAVARLSEVSEAAGTGQGESCLERAVEVCRGQYDRRDGGFGGAPKFPQAMTLRFLLLRAVQDNDGDLLEMVRRSADAMARGGLHDQLGGGFHRYCVDAGWSVPHFEKMLYDNALLLGLYADLAAYGAEPLYRQVVERLVDWLAREMSLGHGGFASSTDADSEGVEGRYFVWTPQQVEEALEGEERELFSLFYGVSKPGNFEAGATVLTQRRSLAECARQLGWTGERAAAVLERARAQALQARRLRVAPGRDDKALASWNALTVSSLCRAAGQLGMAEAAKLALRAGDFLRTHFCLPGEDGELARLVAAGRARGHALAEDVGALVLAFMDLYELTLEDAWLEPALSLYQTLIADYWDQDKGLTAMTPARASDIPLRPSDYEDNATPSAHSLLLECARRHFRLTGQARSRAIWEKASASVAPLASRAPTGLGLALQSAVLFQAPSQELVLGGPAEQAREFLPALQGRLLPNLIVARAETPGIAAELGQAKEPGKAYLCSGSSCQPPVSRVADLLEGLAAFLSAGP